MSRVYGEFELGLLWYGNPGIALAEIQRFYPLAFAASVGDILETDPSVPFEILTPGATDDEYGGVEKVAKNMTWELDRLREDGFGLLSAAGVVYDEELWKWTTL